MNNSLIGKSEGDSLSQDTGVFSMPSSMISSNSMALSFAATEMDSSGFFSDVETGRSSSSAEPEEPVPAMVVTKHQISPITENSEPESSSSHESQLECHKSSSLLKLSNSDQDDKSSVLLDLQSNQSTHETVRIPSYIFSLSLNFIISLVVMKALYFQTLNFIQYFIQN